MGSKHCCRDDQRRGASGWLTPCRGKALEKVAFQAVTCLGSPCDCAVCTYQVPSWALAMDMCVPDAKIPFLP